MYLCSQLAAALSFGILYACALLHVRRETFRLCNLFVNLFWGLQYVFLGAWTGALCSLFCTVMVGVFCFKGRVAALSRAYVPLLFAAGFAAQGLITWDGLPSLIPVAGNLLLVLALWADREVLCKAIFIPVALLWVLYACLYFSLLGIIGQSLSALCNVLFLLRHARERKCFGQEGETPYE